MKVKLTLFLSLAVVTSLTAQTATTNSLSLNPNIVIPDGSPVGLTESLNLSCVGGPISAVTFSLDITGGFNGDLYAYLVSPQGQLAVLLNRPGITSANALGYGDGGLNITLDNTAAVNVHDYGSGSYSVNGSGQVTGTWAPDGRAIDPQSSGTVFDAATTTANLGLFTGGNADGTWTFFIADLSSGGGTATLNNLALNVITVPEPQTWAMFGGGLVLLGWLRRFRQKR